MKQPEFNTSLDLPPNPHEHLPHIGRRQPKPSCEFRGGESITIPAPHNELAPWRELTQTLSNGLDRQWLLPFIRLYVSFQEDLCKFCMQDSLSPRIFAGLIPDYICSNPPKPFAKISRAVK